MLCRCMELLYRNSYIESTSTKEYKILDILDMDKFPIKYCTYGVCDVKLRKQSQKSQSKLVS